MSPRERSAAVTSGRKVIARRPSVKSITPARTVEFEREAHRQAAHLCPECGTRAGEEE